MNSTSLTAEFVSGSRGPLLVVMRQPRAARGCVLIAPPFAEEMNKSRRMLTEAAHALASRGFATVLPDLYGTGDSAGEFVEADWTSWVGDVRRVYDWAHGKGVAITSVLGVRLGCALAAQALAEHGAAVQASAFWQPVGDGSRFFTQFLRLRVAASMTSPAGAESVTQLKQRLRETGRLEVGGYECSARLAEEIEAVRLDPLLGAQVGRVHWLEVVREGGELPGPSRTSVQQAQERGVSVQARAVVGEPFWSSTEIVVVPELIEQTVQALAA